MTTNVNIQPAIFNENEERFANQFEKDAIKIIEEQSQKLDSLMVDKMTGLPSNLALGSLIENFDRTKYPPGTVFACVYIDLKQTKDINDATNHDIGDEYITTCAQALKKCFRINNEQNKEQDIILHLERQESKEDTSLHRQHDTGDEFLAFIFFIPKPGMSSPEMVEPINSIISQRLERVKEIASNVEGRNVDFRFGISQHKSPESSVSNQEFFKVLINEADQNLNLKRKQEIGSQNETQYIEGAGI